MNLHNHREWFREYVSAMLEMDEGKILGRVEAAFQAIRRRIAEINSAKNSEYERERQDITYALNHLKRLQVLIAAA